MQAIGHIFVCRERINSAMIGWIPDIEPECQLGLKTPAYFEANCSWGVQRGGTWIGKWETFLVVKKDQ